MTDDCCDVEIESKEQARMLWVVLAINASMFIAEFVLGIIAQSTGLIADSLDMLADATVYAISLYAVGKATSVKTRAALLSGFFQIALALGVAGEILRRLIWGSEPDAFYMIGVSAIALVANVICLALLAKHRNGEVHMRASWVFSKNDVIANCGVIVSGILVATLGSRWPDLVVGAIIVFVVMRGGIQILADARREDTAEPSG